MGEGERIVTYNQKYLLLCILSLLCFGFLPHPFFLRVDVLLHFTLAESQEHSSGVALSTKGGFLMRAGYLARKVQLGILFILLVGRVTCISVIKNSVFDTFWNCCPLFLKLVVLYKKWGDRYGMTLGLEQTNPQIIVKVDCSLASPNHDFYLHVVSEYSVIFSRL